MEYLCVCIISMLFSHFFVFGLPASSVLLTVLVFVVFQGIRDTDCRVLFYGCFHFAGVRGELRADPTDRLI